MATFFLFGSYTTEALAEIGADRTAKATALVEDLGGRVVSMHVLLGDRDLVLIVELPDVAAAVKASVALTKMTKIAFSTSQAMSVAEFDRLAG